ncbi:Gfo/Idh/MocA family protein [Promicromonospora sp. Populi]|uniref:Gfo/Idh/MocA family protein n=1 Tax=Promicromonospora sp. Populi TaxID=3239420 RepID=UPI0034E1BB6C
MSAVRVGVIGAGIMGTDHATLLHGSVSGATVTAVADVDVDRAGRLAVAVGAQAFDSGEELIARGTIDALVVASHDASHAGYTLAAIERGLPVLCEKPLAPTRAECDAIIAAERGTGRRLVSVGFMRRFDPAYVELKHRIDDGSIGRPVMVTAQSRGVSSAPDATSSSSITGSAIHEFDAVPWLLSSPIVEVRWFAPESAVAGMSDPQVMIVRTQDGALAVLETFLNARYGYDIRCEAIGTEGTVQLTDPAATTLTGALRAATTYPANWRPRFADAYRRELQAWVDATRTGVQAPSLATAEDGLRATLIAEAAISSMLADGAPVPVESVDSVDPVETA